MNRTRRLLFVIATFVLSAITLGLSLFLYIYWYMEVSAGLESLIQKFNLDHVDIAAADTWVVVTVLSVLVGLILIGFFLIFVYSIKSFQLFRLQRNFINNFTHELKTPVTSLQLYLETFLKHDLERKDQVKYIHSMMEDVSRLSSTISSILKLAEIESRTYAGDFIETDVVRAVRSFYEKNSHRFKVCGFSLITPPGGSLYCLLNRDLLDMLLMNLFTNAVKYNNTDPPRIAVTIGKRGKKAEIRFADNGIGIEKANRKKIFKRFFQVGSADDRSARGSGLGLYLTANIVRLHKGDIRIVEGPDPGISNQDTSSKTGTVFLITLPLLKGAPPEK